jgi:osomolarity two-component system, response regulator SSK1
MGQRKIWVKRPGASATLVALAEDSVVDELRDHVLRKYSNSLGRSFDSPDLCIKIASRENASRQIAGERLLSPEEPLIPLIDSYYPGGQTVNEALIIDAPARRTPKPSPRFCHSGVGEEESYFPLMPVNVKGGTPPPNAQSTMPPPNSGVSTHPPPSMSVLTTGKVPPLPSPGGRSGRSSRPRPPLVRHKTGSPTLVSSVVVTKGE